MNLFPSRPSFLRPVAALVAVLSLAGPARAQEGGDDFRTGTHALRRILHDSELKALSDWDEIDAGNTLLVLLGRVDLGRIPGGLPRFFDRGGAVLLAADQELRDPALLSVTGGVFVHGDQVTGWPRFGGRGIHVKQEDVYRGFMGGLPECLLVRPARGADPALFGGAALPGAMARAPLAVATNRPSYLLRDLRYPVTGARPLAWFPPGCWYGAQLEPWGGPAPFAVAVARAGRLLLLADHSVFINEMMLQEDNGNVELAYNAVDWLRDGTRNRVLFVEDGEILTRLDVPVRKIDLPLRQLQLALVDYGNELMVGLQDRHAADNRINEAAIDSTERSVGRWLFGGRGRRQSYYLMVALLAGLGVVAYGVARLRRASFKPEPFVPLFATAAARHAPASSVLGQRSRYALQEDNFGDYAHVLASEWLASVLPGGVPTSPPRVEAAGGWWHRWAVRARVRHLWRLAQADVPPRLSQREFRRLLADLERLRADVASGDVRLE